MDVPNAGRIIHTVLDRFAAAVFAMDKRIVVTVRQTCINTVDLWVYSYYPNQGLVRYGRL
jgi:hypothetical protein